MTQQKVKIGEIHQLFYWKEGGDYKSETAIENLHSGIPTLKIHDYELRRYNLGKKSKNDGSYHFTM